MSDRMRADRRDEAVEDPGPSTASDDAVQQAQRWLAQLGVASPPEVAAVADPTPLGSDGVTTEEGGSRPYDGQDAEADPESVARTIVLRKLAAQARTRAELERALKVRRVPEAAVQTVLDRMQSVGLIDDGAFARDWVESRQQRRHLSKNALRRELEAKGVEREEVESAVGSVDSDDELNAARSLASRRVRSMAGVDRATQRRRLAGQLGRRGFSSALVSRVVAETLDAAET